MRQRETRGREIASQTLTYRMNRNELARFMRNVEVQPDGCWYWIGPTYPNGYPKARKGPGSPERAAHRVMWEHWNNSSIPEGLQLGHGCHDRAVEQGECEGGADCQHRRCVSPHHTVPQTPSENILLSNHAGRRKTHCPQGHEYTEENTIRRDGRRWCRTCEKARKR